MTTRMFVSKMSKLIEKIGNPQTLFRVFIALMILCSSFVVFITHKTVDTTTPVTIKRPNSTLNCSDVAQKMMSSKANGRLGNQLYLYATLYAFAKQNNPTAFMSPTMASHISPYFKISMGKISQRQVKCVSWKTVPFPSNPKNCMKPQMMIQEPYVMFTGYPPSYKCFEDYLPEIRKELQFKEQIVRRSKQKIRKIVKNFGNNATTVGVHVRRTDYIQYAIRKKFQLPTIKFYKGAMKYFQEKYANVIFIIASDDIPWCKSNFHGSEFNVQFLSGTAAKGVEDLAVLAHCDHLIFGVGTFGFWAGVFNKGQVLYCSDCHSKNSTSRSSRLKVMTLEDFILPTWIGFNLEGKQRFFTKLKDK